MSNFAENLAKEVHGMTASEAWMKGICLNCKKPPTLYSREGRKEYRMSAICEPCFDSITAEEEEEEF